MQPDAKLHRFDQIPGQGFREDETEVDYLRFEIQSRNMYICLSAPLPYFYLIMKTLFLFLFTTVVFGITACKLTPNVTPPMPVPQPQIKLNTFIEAPWGYQSTRTSALAFDSKGDVKFQQFR
ncbi:MAG: hypothetical protein LH609_09885 [Rudanella sp.]|nr:hypothetical protein [Rudanella sp.]